MFYGIRTLRWSPDLGDKSVVITLNVHITKEGAFWQKVQCLSSPTGKDDVLTLRDHISDTQCRGIVYTQEEVDKWDIELSPPLSTSPWQNFMAKVLWVIDDNIIKRDNYVELVKKLNPYFYEYLYGNVSLPALACLFESQTIMLISALYERFKLVREILKSYRQLPSISIRGYNVNILDHGFPKEAEQEALRDGGGAHIFLHRETKDGQWYLYFNREKSGAPNCNKKLLAGVTFSPEADLSDCIEQISSLLR